MKSLQTRNQVGVFKRLLCIMFAAILMQTTLFSGQAQAAVQPGGNLTCWHQSTNDPYQIGKWNKTSISYAIKNLHADLQFPIVSSCSSAKEAWSKALGVSISSTLSTSAADIPIFSGTYKELEAIGISSSTGSWAGITFPEMGYSNNYYYGGATVSGYTISYAKIGIVCDWMTVYDEIPKRVLHEFGHAMGWLGHAKSNSYIMWNQSSSSTTKSLSDGDIKHLSQIYK